MTGGGPRARLPIGGLAAAAAAALAMGWRLSSFHALPWLQPDSATYLEANIARTPAYPLFLKAVSRLPGGFSTIGVIQHVALVGAALWLAARFARAFGQRWLSWLLFASIVLNPLLVSYCFTVLPESLFVAALMLHLGCVLMLAERGLRRPTAIAIGVSAVMLALLKPAGYAAVAGLAVVALEWRREWRVWPWLAGSAAALLLLACAGNLYWRGIFATQAQGGYSRVAYVGHLLDAGTVTPVPRVSAEIAAATAGVREAMAQLPGATLPYLVGAAQYHVAESAALHAIVAEIERRRGAPVADDRMFPRDPSVILAINAIGGPIADRAIRARPGDYARLVAVNVFGLWWQPLIQSGAALPALRTRLDAEYRRHPQLDRSPIAFRALPWPAFLAVKGVLLAVAVCSVLAVVLVFSDAPRRRVVGYSGVFLHGYFLLVSLAQPGLPRYALAVWPASMLLLCGTFAAARDRSA